MAYPRHVGAHVRERLWLLRGGAGQPLIPRGYDSSAGRGSAGSPWGGLPSRSRDCDGSRTAEGAQFELGAQLWAEIVAAAVEVLEERLGPDKDDDLRFSEV